MAGEPGNLFDGVAGFGRRTDEEIAVLLATPGLRIERIVSTGQASPPGFWYDQERPEWVLLVQGAAALEIQDATTGQTAVRDLRPGDYLHIPAHCRHRVAWTDPDRPTIWLAIHYD